MQCVLRRARAQLAAALMPEHELSCLAWGCLYACCPKFQCCLRTWLRTELRKQVTRRLLW